MYHLGMRSAVECLTWPVLVVITFELLAALTDGRSTAQATRLEAVSPQFERVKPVPDVVPVAILDLMALRRSSKCSSIAVGVEA